MSQKSHSPFLLVALCSLLLAASGCGDDTPPGTGSCSPANCTGCCQGDVCHPGTTETSCGAAGQACVACGGEQQCAAGSCGTGLQCNANNCPFGCCQGGACLLGAAKDACGGGGQTCRVCGDGEVCSAQSCVVSSSCNATNCPSGCCDSGVCRPGTAQDACGKDGLACTTCGGAEVCTNQSCLSAACDATNCSGCCDSGVCKTGASVDACGAGGQACKSCGANELCAAGECTASTTCNPSNCASSCCENGVCKPGTAKDACGGGGNVCSTCASSQSCSGQTCRCDSTSCSGCCDGDICRPGTDNSACGIGTTCSACTGTQFCQGGNCSEPPSCSAANCSGCCDGATCRQGDQLTACGTGGQLCKTCSSPETCTQGACTNTATCNYSNCKTGCCDGSQCLAGTTASACGKLATTCQVCQSWQVCGSTYQLCEVDPASKWDVVIVGAWISGTSWDLGTPAYQPPDPYAEVKFDGSVKKTTVKNNTFKPLWNELLFTTTAAKLLGNVINISVYDEDVGPAEFIGMSTYKYVKDVSGGMTPVIVTMGYFTDKPQLKLIAK